MYEEEIHFLNCYLNSFGRFDIRDFDPKIDRVPLLSRMDVWTKFEEDMSRHSRVIEWKQFWHI